MILGAGVGFIGGVVGFLVAQAVLFPVGELFLSYSNFEKLGLPLSRSVGWGIVGLFVGVGEGVRARSGKKIAVGLLGGLLGGLSGGLVLEYSRYIVSSIHISRLLGLTVLGLAIGLFYGLIERGMAAGVLRVLNGRLKGKEYLLNQNRIRIGSSRRCDIVMTGYELADRHAQIRIKKGEALLSRTEGKPVLVNEKTISEHRLKYEDVIKIGSAKVFYRYQ